MSAWVGLVVVASLLMPVGFETAADSWSAPDEGRALPGAADGVSALYVDPANRFQITVPAGWEVASYVASPGVILVTPNESASIAVTPEPWCGASSTDAVALLKSQLTTDRFGPLEILEPPASLSINGQTGAISFFRYYLADGAALQTRSVILAPEWSLAWTFGGAMNDASAFYLGDVINATLGTFQVLPGPAPLTVSHPTSHFQVTLPAGWASQLNATVGTETVDLLLTHPEFTGTIAVASESRAASGTSAEARQILQETLGQLATEPGFRILEPVTDTSVDAHPAASAVVTYQPSTYNLEQTLTVVVGAEWSRTWAVIGTMFSWEATRTRACVNATLASLDIATAPPGQAVAGFLLAHSEWILIGALVATAVEGAALGLLVVRQSRRRRP